MADFEFTVVDLDAFNIPHTNNQTGVYNPAAGEVETITVTDNTNSVFQDNDHTGGSGRHSQFLDGDYGIGADGTGIYSTAYNTVTERGPDGTVLDTFRAYVLATDTNDNNTAATYGWVATTKPFVEGNTYTFGYSSAGTAGNVPFSDLATFTAPDGIVDGEETGEVMGPGYNDAGQATDGGGDIIDGADGDNDTIHGNGGDDTINAGAGRDRVEGGTGNDSIQGGAERDTIRGGEGNDTIFGGAGDSDWLFGDEGDDTIVGGTGDNVADFIWGGTGNDNIDGGGGDDILRGEDGNDTIDGGSGSDTIEGGAGDDYIFQSQNNGTLYDNQADSIDAGTGDDTIVSSFGADTIDGGDGTDLFDASMRGQDVDADLTAGTIEYTGTSTSGAGAQQISNVENVYGGHGDDTIIGDDVDNVLHGNQGTDTIEGGAGNDTIDGGTDNDSLDGGIGADSVLGGAGNDTITGNSGDDTVDGGAGDDDLSGGSGDDTVYGGDGNDVIHGDNGDGDTLISNSFTSSDEGWMSKPRISDPAEEVEYDPDGGVIGNSDDIGGRGYLVAPSSYTGDQSAMVGGALTFDMKPSDAAPISSVTDGVEIDGMLNGSPATIHFGGNLNVINEQWTTNTVNLTASNFTYPNGSAISEADFAQIMSSITEFRIRAEYSSNSGDSTTFDNFTVTSGPGAGEGNDSLKGGAGDDTIFGDGGDDTIDGGDGDDSILGGDGDDSIFGSAGSDTVDGGTGDDFINTRTDPGEGVPDQGLIYPDDPSTPIDESAIYSYPSDVAGVSNGQGGTYGGPDDDRDSVIGGAGNDTILSGDDDDTIDGGVGDDVIDAGFDDDTVTGGAGADSIQGSEGNDTIDGGDDDDIIYGGVSPTDPNYATAQLYDLDDDGITTQADPNSGNNSDSLMGGAGNDQLYGQDDADTLEGGSGDDTLDGGIDDDILDGGTGDDALTGGSGDDTFTGLSGNDTINDFNAGNTGSIDDGDQTNNDFVDLSGYYNQANYDAAVAAGDIDPNVIKNPLQWMRADQADDGILNDTNAGWSTDDTLTIQNGGSSVAGSDLTFDNTNVLCFVRGTKIATDRGEIPVEHLASGDRVITRDNGYQKICWVGSTKRKAIGAVAPILIRGGTFTPESSDLWVSPNHRLLLRGLASEFAGGESETLAPAKHLIDGQKILRVEGGMVEYFHILFEGHEVISGNGHWSESYHPGHVGWTALEYAARQEILEFFPDLADTQGRSSFSTARRILNRHECLVAAQYGL